VGTPLDLGIRFIVEPSGIELSDDEAAMLAELRPAGIMLRRRNFRRDADYSAWLATLENLLGSVRAAVGRDRIIVSIDHEGGQVHRAPPPITRFPYPAFYAAEPQAVDSVAAAMAEELKSIGVNVSFSPCADIHSNPLNPVINQRAFGTTAQEVTAAATRFATGLRAGGITPCAKHFPGHGDTSTDSHVELPVVNRSKAELQQRELAPFAALIHANIEMIMSAHIMLPQLDPAAPATISKAIMTDLLRGELGFRGITIADALGMKGISSRVSPQDLGVQAHEAGIDLFLMVGDTVSMRDALTARAALSRYATTTPAAMESLRDTEQRLSRFLADLPQHRCEALSERSLSAHAKLADELGKNAQWAHFSFDPVGFT
jgi:beta-N-acetylhexosaminidase